MAALPSVDLAGLDQPVMDIAVLPHENDVSRVTIRVDNYSHIQSAYGDAAAEILAASVDLFVDQLRVLPCSITMPKPGLISLAFGRKTAQEAAGLVEVVMADLASQPIRLGDVDIYLSLTCPALPEADRSPSSLPAPACQPVGDDEEWAIQYRSDMQIASQVLAAIEDGRISLSWQAVRAAGSPDRVLYHEALARLIGLDGQMHSPGVFVPALERLGLSRLFDRHIVSLVIDELAYFPGARLGVNVSGQSARLDHWWAAALERLTDAPQLAQRLVVEITETAALAPESGRFVSELRTLGCRIALDDFGVGHASVRSAMALSPDIIKVDAFFLRRAGMGDRGEALLEHLIGIAAHCAPIVIVEGVETAEQSQMVGALQAHHFTPANACWQQGYHFGQPSHWREWRHQQAEPQPVSLSQLAARPATGFRAWKDFTGLGHA